MNLPNKKMLVYNKIEMIYYYNIYNNNIKR